MSLLGGMEVLFMQLGISCSGKTYGTCVLSTFCVSTCIIDAITRTAVQAVYTFYDFECPLVLVILSEAFSKIWNSMPWTLPYNVDGSSWIIQKAVVSDCPLQHWPSHPSCAVCIPWDKNVKHCLSDAVDAFSMACSGVCVCVYVCFLCSGWTFCPPFFGTVFFFPWMSATTACDPSPDSHHNCWAPSIKISWHIVKVTYCHTYSIFANPFWNEDIGGVCFWLVFAFVVIVIYPHHDIWRNPSCSLRMFWYNRKKDTGGAPWMLPQPSHRGLPASLKASSLFLQFLHKLTSEFWGAKDLHFSMKCLATEFTSIYYTCCVDANLSIVMFHYFSSLYVTCIDHATVRIRYYLQFTINLNPWLNSKQAHGMS